MGCEAHGIVLSLFGIHYVPGQPTESMKEITAFASIGENPSLHTIFLNLNLFETVNKNCPTAEYFAGKTFVIYDMMPGPRQFNDFHFQYADMCATVMQTHLQAQEWKGPSPSKDHQPNPTPLQRAINGNPLQ